MTGEHDVQAWVGRTREDPFGDIEVERGAILHWCEATENANPLYWDDAAAGKVTGGPIAPPSMLSVWMRPLVWHPERKAQEKPLSLHFDLKKALDLPEGIVMSNEISFATPLRPGDRVRTTQRIRSIGEERTNRLGTGRSWTVDMTYTNQRDEVAGVESYEFFSYKAGSPKGSAGSRPPAREESGGKPLPALEVDVTARMVVMGASSSRDWQPQHHDHAWAVERAGTRDIFLNTPNQAGWIERYITDWTGPEGRLGRLRFRMKRPVCPGDRLVFNGAVTSEEPGWADLGITLTVGEAVVTECTARVAVPDQDNPWSREPWRP